MAANPSQRRTILEKLERLPPERMRQVEDFVDFLVSQERDTAFEEFLSVADEVTKAGVSPMSVEEIQAEIEAYRNERRRAARP